MKNNKSYKIFIIICLEASNLVNLKLYIESCVNVVEIF